ncbi:MAG: alpha/beta hydrolase [Chitinophagales bacterium]
MFKKIALSIVVVLVACFLYAVYGRKDLTLTKAYMKDKYSLPNSHFISWNGDTIHYTESGSGFPILMIHGFGGSNYDFKILDSLLNDKYRIIRVDMPGFGLSDYPKTKGKEDFINTYNAYFDFIIDTLHLDSMYVFGNSLGGLMAWNLTVRHPQNVKKLILFNSAGYDMAEVIQEATNARFLRLGIVQLLLHKGLPVFVTKKAMTRIFYDQHLVTQDRAIRFNDFWNRKGNLQQILSMINSHKYIDQNLIKTITCPTLIFWGKEDHVVNPKYADRFHADIKNSEKIMYDSCGHVPMLERPLDVQRDVQLFLNK